MSFVGAIRPLVKGDASRGDPWPAVLLALGFGLSAFGTFAAVWLLGAGLLSDTRSTAAMWLIAAAVLAVLAAADAGWLGLKTPMWRRQTPKWFAYRFRYRVTAFLWGVDTGLVVTTIRVTSLSWAALALALTGLVPWWAGVAFALGFVTPELALSLLVPRRGDPGGRTDPEPGWLVDALVRIRPRLRAIGIVTLTGGVGWTALAALLTG